MALVCRPRPIRVASAEWKYDSKRQVASIITALTWEVTWARSLAWWLGKEAFVFLGLPWVGSRPSISFCHASLDDLKSRIYPIVLLDTIPATTPSFSGHQCPPKFQSNTSAPTLAGLSLLRHRSVTCRHSLDLSLRNRQGPHDQQALDRDLTFLKMICQGLEPLHRTAQATLVFAVMVDKWITVGSWGGGTGKQRRLWILLVLILPKSVRLSTSKW